MRAMSFYTLSLGAGNLIDLQQRVHHSIPICEKKTNVGADGYAEAFPKPNEGKADSAQSILKQAMP